MLLKLLGPSLGYALSSLCLSIFISPSLTPLITQDDPRWMGAWWMGRIILGTLLALCASLLALFPRVLPKAAARKAAESQKTKLEKGEKSNQEHEAGQETNFSASFSGNASHYPPSPIHLPSLSNAG